MKTRYLFFWLALLPVFSFCVNPAQVIENETVEEISEDIKYAVERYRELSNDGSIDDSFLFFTDPHLLDYNNNFGKETKDKLVASFSSAKEVYNYLSLGFCLCGGDWLIQGDTQAIAKEKLLFADTTMKSMFSHYYKVMGNHDTNYQGIVSDDDPRRGDFSRDYIDNTYFTETGSSYYSFMGKTTRFYILDSGLDYTTNMNDFRWEQLLWLADQLQYPNILSSSPPTFCRSGRGLPPELR